MPQEAPEPALEGGGDWPCSCLVGSAGSHRPEHVRFLSAERLGVERPALAASTGLNALMPARSNGLLGNGHHVATGFVTILVAESTQTKRMTPGSLGVNGQTTKSA